MGFVSLDEILRLLIRSGQRGSVAVRGDGMEGRVFVTRGGITLATTLSDDGLETLFRKAQVTFPTAGSSAPEDPEVVELIREISVESIYRMNLHGDTFDVAQGAETRFASPKPFELEQLLEESRRRLEDWAEVSQIVSDLDAKIAFERDLGDREEVRIRRDAWRVLSEVGAGASVAEIAAALGTTEFWAARIVARLVEDDLLKTLDGAGEAAEPTWDRPASEPRPADSGFEHDYSFGYEQSDPGPTARQPDVKEPAVGMEDLGRFSEPPDTYEEPAEKAFAEPAEVEHAPPWVGASDIPAAGVEAETDETDEAAPDPTKGWWQEPSDDAGDEPEREDDKDVEEDTEAFLEKVFSELDSSDDGADEGYGLLRRRRLGAMRDIPRDT